MTCRAKVHAKGTEADIRALMEHADTVAEIQNTLRAGKSLQSEYGQVFPVDFKKRLESRVTAEDVT